MDIPDLSADINIQDTKLKDSSGNEKLRQTRLCLFLYNESTYIEKESITVEECLSYLTNPSPAWIQVYGLYDPAVISELGNHFKIHPLAVEDILNTHQRPKLDVYQDQLFITMRLLSINERKSIRDEQLSLVIGDGYLITFSEEKEEFFNAIKDKLRRGNQRIRKQGVDYLAYTIIDDIVDRYFFVLEFIDNETINLENELMNASNQTLVQRIQKARREMIFLRKSIWPLRDVINQFEKIENPLVTRTTQIYLRDVYDHVIRIIDTIEGMRDLVGGMLDIYLSNINIRTNEVMKFLTVVSTLFVPLTFITSVYGMNFKYIPELDFVYGYPVILFLMMCIATCMLYYFRRKKWI